MKKVTFICALVLLVLNAFLIIIFIPTVSSAENKLYWSWGEILLRQMPPLGQDEQIDRLRCGDYFLSCLCGDKPGQPAKNQISFHFHKEMNGIKAIIADDEFFKDIEVEIDESKNIPTAELFWEEAQNKRTIKNVIIRISSSQYEKSPCLLLIKKLKLKKI